MSSFAEVSQFCQPMLILKMVAETRETLGQINILIW